ncbi:unconventional myosin-Ia-like [Eriocheir sinensis]|uniref:unconventional myosin-Ia-like n=1 Tax=Eriocheir sinensis TaxID=95602 RepID=UPI0021C59FA8|nr:unconventional myosin-Ia-like [Eriocheir sinensis]
MEGAAPPCPRHLVEAEVHPQPPPPDPPDSPSHVPNGPLVVPEVPAFLRGGAAMTGGGPPSPPPLLTTFGRPRPLDPRVEQLRGRRAPKAVAAPAVRGRNGFSRPRRVTFLVEPLPAGNPYGDPYRDPYGDPYGDSHGDEDDEEDDDELSELTRGADHDAHHADDQAAAAAAAAAAPGEPRRPSLRPGQPDPTATTVTSGRAMNTHPRAHTHQHTHHPALKNHAGMGHGVAANLTSAHIHVASTPITSRPGSSASLVGVGVGAGVGVGVASLEGEVGCPDCAALYPVSEEAVLHNLHSRYKRDQIYTYIGTSLVSVNPYRRLALYSHDVIQAYRTSCVFQLPPHIYAVADAAHRGVWERNTDQVVVVAGESGAGKTEAAKLVLQFVVDRPDPCPRLLHSNPVLEAFGNARTRRNDNSSRFGKYTELEFDHKGDPIGGTITHYLLEKPRVTSHLPGERNFHIFYQLLAGADIQILKALKLQRNTENYNLLQCTRLTPGETQDDRAEFSITKRALDVLGLTQEEQLEVMKVVAAVLKLGNLTFTCVNNIDGTEGCVNENEYELHEVCELLSCEVGSLSAALQTRTVEARGEAVLAELSAAEATRTRDALCRALYSRLFTWVVARVNEAIKVKTLGRRKVLGILDIFGFEMQELNSFEQLVINFCNEKLHQVLTEVTLRQVQEDYLREGLEWSLRRQTGVLAVVEDVCSRVGGGSEALLQQLSFSCGGHSLFDIKGGRHSHSDNNIPSDSFRIRHYAGSVTYSVSGFVEKNSDSLHRDLSRCMYRCSHRILKELFPEGNPRRTTLKRPASVATQVLISVSALMRVIRTKQTHLITCIKPNELKQPRILESALVLHQIKYHGLVEQARVRGEGWSYRASHELFLSRYGMLSLHTWPAWRGAPLEGCAMLLADLPLTPSQYTFGRSKVFIKSQRAVHELEEYRRERLEDLAILVQKTYRGWRERTRYRAMRRAQVTISTCWRSWKAREEYRQLKQKKKVEWAAGVIQLSFINYQRWRYVMRVLEEMPSDSPIDGSWPPPPAAMAEVALQLRRLHHKWRCHRYRLQFDQTARNRMREKVTASIIFKERKASYPKSISHPFLGDYVRLRQNGQWKKLAAETNDQYVVFADIVNKITRSAGKFVPILLAVSTNSLLILDQRTLQIKYRIPALEIQRISLSPYLDDIAVLHVKPASPTADVTGSQNLNPGCLFGSDEVKRKGDLVLQTGHVIEVVTKLFLVVQNAAGKPPDVNISTEFDANFGQHSVLFTFKTAGLAEVAPGQIRIMRRHNRMEVVL